MLTKKIKKKTKKIQKLNQKIDLENVIYKTYIIIYIKHNGDTHTHPCNNEFRL